MVDLLFGSLATAIAVVAIAAIGFLMLTGRIEFRRAGTVILGCFLLFGAGAIAKGLTRLAATEAASGDRVARYAPYQITQAKSKPIPPAPDYDPYAGASLPSPTDRKPDWQALPPRQR